MISMEICQGNIESSEFVKFSIRAYVAEIRKKDPKKCWPFGSLGDPENNEVFSAYQSSESTCLLSPHYPADLNSSDDTTEQTQTTNPSRVEIFDGKEYLPKATTDTSESSGIHNNKGKGVCDGSSGSASSMVSNGQSRHEDSVNESAKIGHNVATDNNKPESDQPRRKPRKFRLLADIYNDPASKLRACSDITNPRENVNRRFVAEIEDDQLSDDITLSAFCRKQKAVEVTDSTLKKKRRTIRVEFPRVDQDKQSKHGSKDSTENDAKIVPRVQSRKKLRTDDVDAQTTAKHKKIKQSSSIILPDYRLLGVQKFNRTDATETANEDSEMEAVMLLARHFKEENPSANEQIRGLVTSMACACAQKKIRLNTTKIPVVYNTHKTFTKEKLQKPFCSVQTVDHPKGTTAIVFQTHKEICSKKASGVVRLVQACETLICSVNRDPADFSIPNADNDFMRGG